MTATQVRTSREHIEALIKGSDESAARQWDADHLAALGLTGVPDLHAYGVTVFNAPREATFFVELDGTVRGDPEAVVHVACGLPHNMPNLAATVALARLALRVKQMQDREAIARSAPPSAPVAGWRRLLRIHNSFLVVALVWAFAIIAVLVSAQLSLLIWLAAAAIGAIAVARLITLSERS